MHQRFRKPSEIQRRIRDSKISRLRDALKVGHLHAASSDGRRAFHIHTMLRNMQADVNFIAEELAGTFGQCGNE
jgi:hypothetical protein